MGYYDTTSHMYTVSRMTNILQSMYQKSYKATQFVEYYALSVLYLQKSPLMYIKPFTGRIIPVQQKLAHHTVKKDLHDTQFIVFVRAATNVCKLLRGPAISWTVFKINDFYRDC